MVVKYMIWKCKIACISTFLIFLSFNSLFAQDTPAAVTAESLNQEMVTAGKSIFKNNCNVCHEVHTQKVGPALKNVYERRSLDWIKSFVRNSQKVIQGGDDYAAALYDKFNQTQMTSFDFSDEEIESVVEYIKSETIKGPPVAEVATAPAADGQTATQAGGLSSGVVTGFLIVLLVILVLILAVLFLLVSVLTKYLKQKANLSPEDEEVLMQKFDWRTYVRSPAFIWIMAFIFTAIAAKSVIDGLYSVGVQKGYAPTQPIAFSHKLHAGDFKINCNYCHTGVRKSKNANLPSVNICMNCHSSIVKVTGATELSTEIQKIYDAKLNNTPIEWVRVHNLPDLAYFNHSQHVNVGGVQCQTCHGPIETMEVVKQYSNLTMGWCIDCHRKTKINTDNGYYDKLVKIHNETTKDPMVVKDIGGLECAKCHY